MYFVDKDKLTQKLTYLQNLTQDYGENIKKIIMHLSELHKC